ncbi:MAG TPA: hypothetical protein VGL65_10080 [Gemmatimonadales bacterium]|jgi:hypothetical protein
MVSDRRAFYLLCIALSAGACDAATVSDHATAWGGTNIAVQTTNTSTRFVFPCSAATFTGPLHADADGRFALTGADTLYEGPVRDTLPMGPSFVTVRIDGHVTGDAMTIDVTYPGQADTTTHFAARANAAADYQAVCRE